MINNGLSTRARFRIIPIVLSIIFLLTIILPLIWMFFSANGESFQKVFGKDQLLQVLGRSLLASGLTTVISISLAYILAICTERTNMVGKKIFRVLITLPMLIPSVSIGMGAVLLGGNNGFITNLFGWDNSHIYGLVGIVWGSVMYSFPVAYTMIANILKYEDYSPYEAATILGLSKGHRFKIISFPYLRKPMVAVIFSVFTLSFTDYGVPLMVGGKFKTLPMLMYQEVIGQLDFGKGSVYGMILLVPAVIAFLLDMLNKNQANSTYVIRPFQPRRKLGRDVAATVITGLLTVLALTPILSFTVLAFVKQYPTDMTITLDHLTRTLQMNGGRYLINSVIISVSVSVIGVILSVLCAYCSARVGGHLSRLIHLVAMATAAIPGVVLGLSYALFFKNSPIYGTLVLLVMVNTVHFFSSPYLMIYTSFSKLNRNLEAVAATLNINRMRLLIDIMLPTCKRTVAEMFSFFFVNCMMTISAVSFLANTANKPIALMINQFEAQAQMEEAAVVSLLILLVNMAVKLIAEGLWKTKKKST